MININKETGVIEVLNDGDGIDVEIHPEHNVYIPEMILGQALTSTNYNKDVIRTVGGTNGIGGTCANIFSKEFIIETVDHERKKMYRQRFYNNMKEKDSPIITRCTKKPYTIIKFLPDYSKFGLPGLTDDMYKMFEKRVYDACAVTNNKVSIYLNDQKIDCKNFEKYVDLYIGAKSEQVRIYEQVNDRWEVAVTYSDDGFKQVSFVNGICCFRGGKHVDHVVSQITKKLVDMVKDKKKKTVKANHIKEYMQVFVKSTIVNPSFDSQCKETLTTQVAKFGSKCELSDKFMDKVYKCGIIDRAVKLSDFQEEKSLSKLDAKKKSRVIVPNLDDANKAGGKESDKCTLMICEGLSARTLGISGLSEIGRDYWGVWCVKGKPLNVKDATIKKISDNEEIANLMKIVGLEIGKKYTDLSSLRYGKIMVLSDQDVDGSHICGLLMNLFASMWPTLSQLGFIVRMITPIVKATKGKDIIAFYNLVDYENWKSNLGADMRGWNIKYYKGLGTSTSKEAKEYFRKINMVQFKWADQSETAIDLAFNKKRADDRKKWLMAYNRDITLDYTDPIVTYEEFIHKELIHYSNSDLERSIPCLVDGFKESTRKIFYACMKKKLTSEIKVAQLSGYVSEHSCYHHGEASLEQAIIGMAQNYVGSNNINLLLPKGQFGTRIVGGKDSAATRYIFTELNPLVKCIFNTDDLPLLKYLDDEGYSIEPEYYVPIIPTILVNGAIGIGTGFSTTIPSYDPKDIVKILNSVIDAVKNSTDLFFMNEIIDSLEGLEDPDPWYCGFKGKILKYPTGYVSKGIYHVVDDDTVEITELPVGTWTNDYKEMLDRLLTENKYLKDYSSQYDDLNVKFILKFQPNVLTDLLSTDMKNGLDCKFESEFKLVSTKGLSTSNMHLYNSEGRIQKYSSVVDIIKEFSKVRLSYYFKRKSNMIKTMEHDLLVLSTKSRFINDVISGLVKIMNQKNQAIKDKLHQLDYPEDQMDSLIRMPISQLTYERKLELEQATKECERQLETLKKTRIQDMWSRELKQFMDDYIVYEKKRLDELLESKPVANSKTTKARRTSKK
jgi:DNA topoisomerase-2